MADYYTEEGLAISHTPIQVEIANPSFFDTIEAWIDSTKIFPKEWNILPQTNSEVSSFFEDVGKGITSVLEYPSKLVGQSAANIVNPMVGNLVIILIIVLVGMYFIGKTGAIKVKI